MQKALHEQRRAAKPHSSLLTDAKRTWSSARAKNISKAERQKHIADLVKVVRGKVQDIVFKHDASRIVQTIVKWGNQEQRDQVAAELKGKYKALAESRYSKVRAQKYHSFMVALNRALQFLITKLIRLCPSKRIDILLEFQSHVLRLLLHREASRVIADTFELYASAYERAILMRDFYGREVTLFSVTTGSVEDREKAKKGLRGVLEGADDERRKRAMTSLKDNLVSMCEASLTFHIIYTHHFADSIIQIRAQYDTPLYIVHYGNI